PEGWISVIIAVRSIGPVVIGLAMGSEITIEREKGFYALSMAGLGLCILASTWTQGWLLLGLCIAGLGMAGAIADLLNQVQAVDLSRASDRSAVMAATGLGWNISPMALPLVLGWAADTWGFALMFAGAGVFFVLVALGTPLWYRLLR
ncbi:MAG: MFS transporter, partial [Deltaproteobacteria bacterium]|nr:MFS transporter [Deltaproteobacteria bacterium]